MGLSPSSVLIPSMTAATRPRLGRSGRATYVNSLKHVVDRSAAAGPFDRVKHVPDNVRGICRPRQATHTRWIGGDGRHGQHVNIGSAGPYNRGDPSGRTVLAIPITRP